ncbi:MAG: TRAP transporter large permease subunit [Proteobacteria bacterium]|nr:TRAP transporter large permease subunit [Pseudomonadota bacterium]MBS0371239.1 TRAP transporter large permease subunit [Pseudomonadota bacterium]
MTLALFLVVLLGTMSIGVPIAFALLLCGVALMFQLDMFDSQIVAQNLLNGADSFPLMAVPFFMLAGEIMNTGGLSKRIVNVAMAMVGHVKGGLGYVAILASVILASLSGSAVADAAALSALLVPMMTAAGHDKARSCGLVAAGGIIAPIIPPSIGFIIFGVASGLSISKLFMAGIVPGALMGLALVITWWWCVRSEDVTPPPRKSTREILRTLLDGSWALALPGIIIFGLKFGIFTPTEAAVVAAVYSFIVAVFVYRELPLRNIFKVVTSAAQTTATVMFLVAAALVSAWMITVADLPGQLTDLLAPFLDSPMLLMTIIVLIVLAVGCAMDMTPIILILTPVLLPVVKEAGIDPIYFGVVFMMTLVLGLITPPVGTVLNVVGGVGRINMGDLVKGLAPFLLAQILLLVLFILFPALITVPAKFLS